jgi:hypothetical protein
VGEEPSGMGVAREEAARARVASVYFIVELRCEMQELIKQV